MNMLLDPNQDTGDVGEQAVALAFMRIGWAQPKKVPRDIGDDFITFGRTSVPKVGVSTSKTGKDHDRFDLSAPVLVQVKTSDSKYGKATATHENRKGWWIPETSEDHFDHWLRFDLPYLLVLHDEPSGNSYWAHVHRDAIDDKNKARRIFVPQDQLLDPTSLVALNEVAVSNRTAKYAHLYGPRSALTPGQRLRHAVLAPAFAAPKNIPKNLRYDQVAALLMLDDRDTIRLAVHRNSCPPPNTWGTHKKWGWRFLDALWNTLQGVDSSHLDSLARSAPSKYERDACRLVRGTSVQVQQRPATALNRLQPDRYSKPVDRAWLLTQKAHVLLETGNRAAAAEVAEVALACLVAQGDDVSVAVIRAAATNALYIAASGGEDSSRRQAAADVARASAEQNLGTLWRAETVSEALTKDLTARFKAWSGEQTRNISGGSPSTAQSKLNSAAWNAALSASWGSWRELATQGAKVSLTTNSDPGDVDEALTALTRAGAKAEAKQAATQLWLNGPVEGLASNVAALAALPRWSSRVEGPAMALMAHAGDLLESKVADSVIDRIVKLLKKSPYRLTAGGGWTDRWSEADQALARLLAAATLVGHEQCANLVSEQFASSDARANAVLRIASSLRVEALLEDSKAHLLAAAQLRKDRYRPMLLEQLGEHMPSAIDALKDLAIEGDSDAYRALLVVGDRSPDNWRALGRHTAPIVIEMVERAKGDGKTRSFTHGSTPSLHDLALSAFHTKNYRHWKIVTDSLAAGVLPGEQIDGCVQFLAARFDELPATVQVRLKPIAVSFTAYDDDWFNPDRIDAAVASLRIAAGLMDDGETLAELLTTRHAAGADFARLTGELPIAEKDAFLLACTVDPDPQVRAYAAYGVVRVASQKADRAPALATALMRSLELNDGCRMPIGVASALGDYPVSDFDPVRDELAKHPSGLVRNLLV